VPSAENQSKQRFALLFPGDPETLTGGFLYDRTIRDQLIGLGHDIRTLVLHGPFPQSDAALNAELVRQAAGAMADVPSGHPLVIDGLALGGFGEAVAPLAVNHPLIGLVHHPLALETGLSNDVADHFRQTETAALSHCAGVIATSETTRDVLLGEFGVPPKSCVAVPPGVAPFGGIRRPSKPGAPVRLLSVGTLIRRKGHTDTLAALSQLLHLDWTLDIIGDDQLDPEIAAHIRALINEQHLQSRITIHGKLPKDQLQGFFGTADLFVLAAHYEGYGMAFAEAVAAGLPVIGTTGGAIPRTVPEECGILVPPGDVPALKDALARLIGEPELLSRYADAARDAAGSFKDWPERAEAFSGAVALFAERWQAGTPGKAGRMKQAGASQDG
jgi:glycosyltransferase involved in cell wall biosynthesis